jgi:hypothetical protein
MRARPSLSSLSSLLLTLAIGCGRGPTTAVIAVDAPPTTTVIALYAQLVVDGAAGSESQVAPGGGAITLPGTLTIWLSDEASATTIRLRAITSDGAQLAGQVTVNAIPYREVDATVHLREVTVGSGGGGSDGAPTSDLGGAPDLSEQSINPPPPPPPPPDLSSPSGTVLARDTFQRAPQAGWGTATDGQVWSGNANTTQTTFAIVNNSGVANERPTTDDSAMLGPTVGDADVLIDAMFSSFSGGTSGDNELGPMLRFVDNSNFYKAGVDGNNLRIAARVAGHFSTLDTVAFSATPGVTYRVRFRAVGGDLSAKAWAASDPEPSNWMVTANDTSLPTGQCGVRLVFKSVAVASVTSFLATVP